MAWIRRRTVESDGLALSVREAGSAARPAFVLLHGWPQTSRAFEPLMAALAEDFFVVAPDLPGVGDSRPAPPSGDKRALARHVRRVVGACEARSVLLVGHDAGGTIAFAALRENPRDFVGVALLSTLVPGVPPWAEVIANPQLWHFAFHAVPELPETLIGGRERVYFDYFFDLFAHAPAAISEEARETYAAGYARPDALRAGFDWYRAFPEDARANARPAELRTPLLYLRGEHDPGDLAEYVEGFRRAGFVHVIGDRVPGAGHFAPDEAPRELALRLRAFREACDDAAL